MLFVGIGIFILMVAVALGNGYVNYRIANKPGSEDKDYVIPIMAIIVTFFFFILGILFTIIHWFDTRRRV